MPEIIGVRFRSAGRIYYFDPCGNTLSKGDSVIVETSRGTECGDVMVANKHIEEEDFTQPLKPVLRRATEQDLEQVRQNLEREEFAMKICAEKVRKHNLEMKLIGAEYTFDKNKVLFYFTADGRVDFRDLVKDLASVLKTRIELRQIGVRDEAKALGGIGICGRPFCCATFLDDFQPVSIKMAKEQGLSLNPTKISGTCGRLMCCLKYEQDAYEDLIRTTPRQGSTVQTPDGSGIVTEVNLISGNLKVRIDGAASPVPASYHKSQLTTLSQPRRKDKPAPDKGKPQPGRKDPDN
jgi:cell fate regulator YaaT (PSP1 superfamily)